MKTTTLLHMDPIFSFPREDNDLLFQNGCGGYDHIFEDLMFFDTGFSENGRISMREEVFHVEDCEYIQNFGFFVDAVEANPNGDLYGCIEEEENHGDDGSSAGGDNQVNMIKSRRDRSKTIVSERKRRGRMKEKLYELRSLVPNITKMDKASIIADAIVYVQGLQRQAKKLTEEITSLETSTNEEEAFSTTYIDRVTQTMQCKKIYRGKILGVMAHEVGEKRFHVKIECNREDGAASSLYNSIESLECFEVESSIMSCTSERYICTLIFNCKGMGEEMNQSAMKYWVMGALLKEGFHFMTTTI